MQPFSSDRFRQWSTAWLVFLCMPAAVLSQAPIDSTFLQAYIESQLSALDEEIEIDESTFQHLMDLLEDPLDLNACSREDLEQIPWLDPFQIQIFITHRNNNGLFSDVEALHRILDLTPDFIASLRLLGRIREPLAHRPGKGSRERDGAAASLQVAQQFSRRLDLTAGYRRRTDSVSYQGSPVSLYTRAVLRLGTHVSARLVLDKDPGERLVWDPRNATYGFDHAGGAIELKKLGWVDHIVVGDFGVNIGQGLLFERSGGPQKGGHPVLAPMKRRSGIQASASREENAFYRGLAVRSHLLPALSLLIFHSQRTLDATLDGLKEKSDDAARITSLSTTGLHRTPTELAKKDVQYEKLTGGEISIQSNRSRLGFAAYRSQYRLALAPSDAPYKHFAFSGTALGGISIHGAVQSGKAYVFSEIARSLPGDYAAIGGVLLKPGSTFQCLILGRRYSPAYQSFHGHAFGEQRSAPRNEAGWYFGWSLSMTPRWILDGYMDQFIFPWLRFADRQPGRGYESFLRLRYSPREWLAFLVHYRNERSPAPILYASPPNLPVHVNGMLIKHAIRYQMDFTFSAKLSFRFRFEARYAVEQNRLKKGYGMAQDVDYRPDRHTIVRFRLAQFDSDGGDAILYFYEHDVQFRYSIASFTGKGVRNYILFKRALGTYLALELKYAITRYDRMISKGSGNEAFSGRQIRDVRVQFIWRI